MRWPLGLAGAAALLLAGCTSAYAQADATTFGADETRRILAHGPWPPAPTTDPGNAQSGRREAIALGQALFFDLRLSSHGQLACASCHQPGLAFADGRRRSLGRGELDRNAPSLWNAVHERWYGWDGAADSLWGQAIRPIVSPREMDATAVQVRAHIAGDDELACRYRRAFGVTPATGGDEAVLVHAAKAIGAFVATLVSGRTAFDDFRDALARGDAAAMARYPADAQRGLKLFVGRGRCAVCHSGPLFSNGEFGDTGLPFFVRPGEVDPGRQGGLLVLRASPYNLLGRFSDAGADSNAAIKTRHVEPQHRNFGEFKVPSLRNVALTGPYMHDGQLATLDDVVNHYSELNLDRLHADGERILEPLHLDAGERADLVAFLRTLSDAGAAAWQPPPLPRCIGGVKPPA
ncbi:MAG TPA: cytochrome c peroxidase [Burkholderiaceae bacterium]|nr:cytochrome c peroxidase [Burkholderiaceae bacterium]